MKKKISLILIICLIFNITGAICFADGGDCGCDNEYWVSKQDVPNTNYQIWISEPHTNKSHTGRYNYTEHINIVLVDKSNIKYKIKNYHVNVNKRCVEYWESKSGETGKLCVPNLKAASIIITGTIIAGISRIVFVDIDTLKKGAFGASLIAILFDIIQSAGWVLAL